MRAYSLPMIAALAAAAVSPAFAATTLKAPNPDAGVAGDVRCLLTMTALATQKDRQQAGQVARFL